MCGMGDLEVRIDIDINIKGSEWSTDPSCWAGGVGGPEGRARLLKVVG